jgi:hypothetical protein
MLVDVMSSDAARDQSDAPSREAPLEEATGPTPPPRDPHWWGETVLPVGGVVRAVAGPLTIWARRHPREWAIMTVRGSDGSTGEAERGHEVPDDDVPEDAAVERFSFSESPAALLLRPVLADRSVVVRPEGTFAVPSGERVTLFVSTPVWLTISVGRASRGRRRRGRKPPARRDEDALEDVLLTEIPSHRLSDTWFGPSTLVGELCYASRTAGRLAIDELPIRPHRAVTPVTLDNRAATPLVVQRVLVPVPTLALYADQDGGLWTQGVSLTREADVDQAVARVESTPPVVARGPAERLADPRTAAPATAVVRAFSRLFRGGEGQAS